MTSSFYFDPERLGRRRFPDNKSYRAQLNNEASLILSALFDLLPSNYPKDNNTNLAVLYKVLAREAARQQESINYINNDKLYTDTRIEYLQQILGERLFLDQRLVPVTQNDIDYRNFLISIKDAYLLGSKKSVIEDLISNYTKLTVNLKELFLEARKPGSAYGLTDTHKMIIEVFVDDLIASGMDIATINNNLAFFVNATKPAHVLYDTKLIWTEQIDVNKIHDLIFGDLGGGCVPRYIYTPFTEHTVLAQSIMVVGPSTPPGPNIYTIGSIHSETFIIYTTSGIRVYVEPGTDGTLLFGPTGRRILFSDLQIGQTIRLMSLTIPGDFNFYYPPPDVVSDPNSRFYKDIYRKPAFQGFVKKEMDSKGKFPLQIATTPTTICDRWHEDVLQPLYEDLRKDCNQTEEKSHTYEFTLAKHMWSPRFPDDGMDSTNERPTVGDLYSFTMPYAPLTDMSGNLATPSDISVLRDGTALINAVEHVDASSAYVSLQDTAAYWDTTGLGALIITDQLQLQYFYWADGTSYPSATDFLFGLSFWQLPGAPVSNGQGTNVLALPSDVTLTVDGTEVSDAIMALNAVNGIVTLQDQVSFWTSSELGRIPQIGDVFAFDYYQSGTKRYAMLFDDPARTMDDDMVFDGPVTTDDPSRVPVDTMVPIQIGYKFRADLLHHASVLNSFDTLLLNNYQKPAKRASIANRQDTLNHYNYFFSPEFLEDDDPEIVLNDRYLDKDIPPAITLNYGTPPFQKTYASQPGMIREMKLQDIRQNHRLLMYCDLLLKEYYSGDNSIQLSSICDNSPINFSFRFEEEIPSIEECDPWILFDTAETKSMTVQIPGELIPGRNLRISGKDLREDFILRDMTSTGIAHTTYSYQEGDIPVTELYLPETIRTTTIDGQMVDFPSLPIMKDSTTLADPSDIEVKVNGAIVSGIIKTLDPMLGYVELYSLDNLTTIEYIQLTQDQIDNRFVKLANLPTESETVAVNVVHGPAQIYGLDFVVSSDILFLEAPMRNILVAGDILVIIYQTAALDNRVLEFTYKINTTGEVTVMDLEHSRVFDSEYVFPGYCYDGYQVSVGIDDPEYVNFLSDYGKGVKFIYLNKSNYQIEEHIFSGPVFEMYDPNEDEISAMESFPDALIRIMEPLSHEDPMKVLPNYEFLNNDAIRIRKKTLKELLPDRTFKTTQILEAMPV